MPSLPRSVLVVNSKRHENWQSNGQLNATFFLNTVYVIVYYFINGVCFFGSRYVICHQMLSSLLNLYYYYELI